jgi:hypothetical protein
MNVILLHLCGVGFSVRSQNPYGLTAISRETILKQDYRHKGKQANNDK